MRIPADPNDAKTQDVLLAPGLPVIGRINWRYKDATGSTQGGQVLQSLEPRTECNADQLLQDSQESKAAEPTQDPEDLLLANNEPYIVTELRKATVVCATTRAHGYGTTSAPHIFEVPLDKWHKFMLPNFCCTTHKAQGATISEDYTIWEAERMEKNILYTALSRAQRASQINLACYSEGEEARVARRLEREVIGKKISGHKAFDQQHGHETDLTVEFIQQLIKEQQGRCTHCHEELLLYGFSKWEPLQLSIDRICDSKGHVQGNVKVSCFACNCAHHNLTMDKYLKSCKGGPLL
jgi:hypothetical protein